MRGNERLLVLLLSVLVLASCRSMGRADVSEDTRAAFASGASAVTLLAGAVRIELVRIAPGEFTMGSLDGDEDRASNESPTRRVRISKAFYLGRFEITRAQYRVLMGAQPGDGNDDTLPVSQITYADAIEFCRRLSRATNLHISLPTEAQWEYACRAGSRDRYCSGSSEADLDRVAWYTGNSEGSAHPVGRKQPNAWGIHDMLGNVWEYCADFIDDYATMTSTDPLGRVTPRRGAMRGGGWMHGPAECRAATRLSSDDMFGGAGFRIAVGAD